MSRDLSKELTIYNQNKARFEAMNRWRWVVIHEDEIVGFYDDFQDAADVAVTKFGRGPYLIKQVGETPQPLPASVLYNPV